MTLDKTKQLILDYNLSILKSLLMLMTPQLNNLTSIVLGTIFLEEPSWKTDLCNCKNRLNVSFERNQEIHFKLVDMIIKHVRPKNTKLNCTVSVSSNVEFDDIVNEYLSELHLQIFASVSGTTVVRFCPSLTDLSMNISPKSDSNASEILKAIVVAVEANKLPVLKSFWLKCKKLDTFLLFQAHWTTLTHLHITCDEPVEEFNTPFHHSASGLFPNLISLTLNYLSHAKFISYLFCDQWKHLWDLELKIDDWKGLGQVCVVDKMPKLTQLGINVASWKMLNTDQIEMAQWLKQIKVYSLKSACTDADTLMQIPSYVNLQKLKTNTLSPERVSTWLHKRFPSLNTLTLTHGKLISVDLISLQEAHAEGRLPELRHLDISYNKQIMGKLQLLFGAESRWNGLLSLGIKQGLDVEKEKYCDDYSRLCAQVKSGSLTSLENFSFTHCGNNHFSAETCVLWPSLKSVTIIKMVDHSGYLQPICDMVEQGLWPNVKFVKTVNPSNQIMAPIVQHLFQFRERGGYVMNND